MCSGIPYFIPDNIDAEVKHSANVYLKFPEAMINAAPQNVGKFSQRDELFAEIMIPEYDKETVQMAVKIARYKVAEMISE